MQLEWSEVCSACSKTQLASSYALRLMHPFAEKKIHKFKKWIFSYGCGSRLDGKLHLFNPFKNHLFHCVFLFLFITSHEERTIQENKVPQRPSSEHGNCNILHIIKVTANSSEILKRHFWYISRLIYFEMQNPVFEPNLDAEVNDARKTVSTSKTEF